MIAVLAGSLFLVIVFASLVRYKRRELWWGWWSNLMDSLVSVALGLAVGLYLLSVQKLEKDAEDRARYRLLLEAEMTDIAGQLRNSEPVKILIRDSSLHKDFSLRLTLIQPIAIEEAAKSGLFPLEQTKTMFSITREIRLHNMETQNLLNALSSKGSHVPFTAALAQNITPVQEEILKDLGHLAGQLDLRVAGLNAAPVAKSSK